MPQDRICKSCKVEVSSDLSNCPLCGRHIEGGACGENPKSYPVYDTSFVITLAWYTFLKSLFLSAAIVCVVVNLIFPSSIYWCLYVLAALLVTFCVFILPLKVGAKQYIKRLNIDSLFISAFIIFIDAYNHFNFGFAFGWSVEYAAPFVMFAAVLCSTIICFCVKRYEGELLTSIAIMAVFSIIYFIIMVTCFRWLSNWASIVLMGTSVGLVIMLRLFKRHKLISQLAREFHV